MKQYTFILAFVCGSFTMFSQQVTSSEYLLSYDLDYFITELDVPFSKYGVDLYRINYTTTDLTGALDTASGLLVLPQVEDLNLGLVSYSHGTVGSRFEVPSYLSMEHQLPAIYSSMGVVTVAADLLGLGDNEGIHPYVHADSEAWVSNDMIIAVKDFLSQEMDVNLNDDLVITGYSQGGHSAMALHRLIEKETNTEVTVSIPMSGPYSISSGMRDILISDEEYSVVSYLANTAISYQEVYGTIYPNGNIEEFFKAPYVNDISRFVSEEIDLWELDSLLRSRLIMNEGGAFPSKMVFDNIVEDVLADDDHPINIALRDNDVFDWAPISDTRLLYCEGDEQVAFENSLIARDKMHENGATQVQAMNLNSDLNHTECVTPAATSLVFYLLAFVAPTDVQDLLKAEFSFFPNPTDDFINIELGENVQSANVDIYSMTGEKVHSQKGVRDQSKLEFDLHPGIYFMNLSSENGQSLGVKRLSVK